ncbi:hypothetical protein PAEAM_28340 [Paenibacillus sp. GM1FR]|nr:hypothetical protein PAEAM_28340 [Paenibacillus sp. GM1FR]
MKENIKGQNVMQIRYSLSAMFMLWLQKCGGKKSGFVRMDVPIPPDRT